MFPDAPTPLLDLSTGINPYAYPLPPLSPDLFRHLPGNDALADLSSTAARHYGAPSAAHVVAAPGSQSLLPLVARLRPASRAAVLAPTYAEHARALRAAGHTVIETTDLDRLAEADLAVVVNPNNPDGALRPRTQLEALRRALAARDGLLVVDEAFMDVGSPDASLAPLSDAPGLVVLRSFGKFFGLAGLRLGFALAAPERAAALSGALGPWAVSGPAIEIGRVALADAAWCAGMRDTLTRAAARLDAMLARAGLKHVGGTPLFRTVEHPRARVLADALGHRGVVVRSFDTRPTWLRFGLPGAERDWVSLDGALRDATSADQCPSLP